MAPPKQGVTASNGNNVFRGKATQRTRYGANSSGASDQDISVQDGENIFEGDFSQESEEITGGGNNPNPPNIIISPPDNRRPDPTPDPRPTPNPGGHTPGQSAVSVPGAGMQMVCPACGIIWARNNSMANYQTLLRGGHIYS